MRMPWRRSRPKVTKGQQEAAAAVAEAGQALKEVKAAEPQIARVAASMRRMREENHFAESLQAALRGEH
jgi:hypothetical protein